MSGIAGIWRDHSGRMATDVSAMLAKLQHRGPDDHGTYIDPQQVLALGHRRLSILDLSPAGHQPMASPCQRYQLVFNGEIYNYRALRIELQQQYPSITWRGHADTEILLTAISYWGLETTLARLNGMFALALWDTQTRQLTLARDRIGEKPLYYGRVGNAFVFASETQAFANLPGWQGQIDRPALAAYLRHSFVPNPYSLWQGITQLTPGHMVVLNQSNQVPPPSAYWQLPDTKTLGTSALLGSTPANLTDHSYLQQLENLLLDSIQLRCLSDVPLGAFLSGGIDSSLIVGLMAHAQTTPIDTFTIGFNNPHLNEAEHALAIAKHLGTHHNVHMFSAHDALEGAKHLAQVYDQPLADPSAIPTTMLCQLARQQVGVCLSGDGGDELFCGYSKYHSRLRLWQQLDKIPRPLKHSLHHLLSQIPAAILNQLVPNWRNRSQKTGWLLGDKMHNFLPLLNADTQQAFYADFMSHWQDPSLLLSTTTEASTLLQNSRWPKQLELVDAMQWADMHQLLPDDILMKVDRASMHHSLEVRIPLLDHRIIELAWHSPMRFKVRDGKNKWALRQLLAKHVPTALTNRPKQGFTTPLYAWLREVLKDWAHDLLFSPQHNISEFFALAPLERAWHEHQNHTRNWQHTLWPVIMFQAWRQQQKVL